MGGGGGSNFFLVRGDGSVAQIYKMTELFKQFFFRGRSYILGLLLCCSPSEEIELNFEPFIDFLVNFEILVTDLLRCEAFF